MYQLEKMIKCCKTICSFNKISRFVIILLFAFTITCFLLPAKCFAKENGATASKIEDLSPDTDYKFDIDGDGQTDVIKYQSIENESKHTSTIKLYVNKEMVFEKTTDGISFHVSILDLNSRDKHLDFYIENTSESDSIVGSFFAQLKNNKLKTISFEPKKLFKEFNYTHYSIQSMKENGVFKLSIDTPITSTAIGCYNCYVAFQYKDGKILKIPSRYYSLSKDTKKYLYTAVKSFTVQKKAGSNVVAYTVEKGDTLTVDKMYLSKSGKLYFRMVNSNAKKGWIPCDLENLFEQLPAWG